MSTFVVGAFSVWRQDPYSLVFYLFIYSDVLWLIPNSNWLVSAVMSFVLLRGKECGWMVTIACLLHEIWWFYILPRLPGYFSISESVLVERWFSLFLVLLFSSSTTLEMQCAIVISLSSFLLTGIVLYHCRSALSCYISILLGALLEIVLLSICVHEFFVGWFLRWVFSRPLRLFLFVYWMSMLFLTFLILCQQRMQQQALIIQRKYFHFLAVALFLPGTLLDPSFMQYDSKSMIRDRVAFAFALLAFFLNEIIRIKQLWPSQYIDSFMKQFIDDRDDGPLILSHFSLLLACAMPVWTCEFSNPIQMLSGVFVIGIGDAFVGSEGGIHA